MGNLNLLNEANDNILFTSNRSDVIMESGKGMYLYDVNGKEYLDFIGGWAVTCLGHSPDVIKKALEKQAGILVNASPSFYNRKMVEFASLLTKNSCFDKVFFINSGAEANESAIKLARKYGSKYLNGAYEIITMTNSFHGRTLATMSATGKKHWEDLFSPKVPGFVHVPYNDIAAICANINKNTCAIMLEPIQGEGGVNLADINYIKKIREICSENNILLIFDEIQTGIGRTGKMFAYEHYGIEPDIMTLAKGLGGGFPVSAMLTKNKYNIFDAGDQGGTYSAQPLAMAVGIAVINEIMDKGMLKNVENQGNYIIEKLQGIKDQFNIKSIRGKGLLIAFELPSEKASDIVEEALNEGLIINAPNPSTIRLMPPFILSEKDTDKMIEILTKVLNKYK